tara:strand:- start:176 stop:559 length:384 start_codon:yes stop_codon:yes gene_type:complete
MIKKTLTTIIALVFLASIVTAIEISVDVEKGTCESVDLNDDTVADILACYDEELGPQLYNVVPLNETLESLVEEESDDFSAFKGKVKPGNGWVLKVTGRTRALIHEETGAIDLIQNRPIHTGGRRLY